jgi:hypothetical protein
MDGQPPDPNTGGDKERVAKRWRGHRRTRLADATRRLRAFDQMHFDRGHLVDAQDACAAIPRPVRTGSRLPQPDFCAARAIAALRRGVLSNIARRNATGS